MAEYTKDTSFSPWWIIGGAALMAITNWFASFVAIGTGVKSEWALAGIAAGAYALGGFVVGWKSEGRTILEAGLASIVAMAVAVGVNGVPAIEPVALAIAVAVPFVASMLGAWIGELVQGDVIVTKDD